MNINGINAKDRAKWQYPSTGCVQRPIPHSSDSSAPKNISEPLQEYNETSSSESESNFENISHEPKFFSQKGLDDVVRDLNLSKQASELLALRLKEKNLLSPGTKITVYREREKELRSYFSEENNIVFCSNITNLLIKMGLKQYEPSEWRLFIDS